MTSERSVSSARDRLAIALDTDDLRDAVAMVEQVQGSIGIAKVGLQLFSAAGHDAVHAVRDLGMDVFLDVKLHDIPNTVRGASRVLASLGARYLTVHAAGGVAMLEAAVQGLDEGAAKAGLPAPMVLAVTVLTSEPEASEELLLQRLNAAQAAGCRGVVCAATDLHVVKRAAPDITAVVPGIRPANAPAHDQARVATPADAIRNGADILVIGRAVTGSSNPSAAAADIAAEVTAAVSEP